MFETVLTETVFAPFPTYVCSGTLDRHPLTVVGLPSWSWTTWEQLRCQTSVVTFASWARATDNGQCALLVHLCVPEPFCMALFEDVPCFPVGWPLQIPPQQPNRGGCLSSAKGSSADPADIHECFGGENCLGRGGVTGASRPSSNTFHIASYRAIFVAIASQNSFVLL